MPYADYIPDIGPITLTCEECGQTVTYVKTNGPRRRFCSKRCSSLGASKRYKERRAAQVRTCACGSTEVPKQGKPVCRVCRRDNRDRTDYNRRKRLANHGITPERYDEMLAEQRGRCGCCGTDDPGKREWFIDHDHACCPGIFSCGDCIRGLLCYHCNFLLGNAKDSIEILDRAKKYLEATSQFRLKLQVVRPRCPT